ncbi:MAG TPA: 2'-5' RNA ligase family protein [Candidatus Ozemobacteraceae bacterium]|nr:2'-5' RNA ligase family protein [Candidatus Ozemobacteraceae bacterium]
MESRLAYLDAYIELPEEILKAALVLNRQITASAGGDIDFAHGTIPHVTLYMGLFPEQEIASVKGELAKIAAGTSPFQISLHGIKTGRDGYLFWNADVGTALRRLHEVIVTAINPLRRGAIRDKYLSGSNGFSEDERRNIREYGFPWVFQQFRPHLTIGCIDEKKTAITASVLGHPCVSGNVTAIALGTVGERGVILSAGDTFRFSGCT